MVLKMNPVTLIFAVCLSGILLMTGLKTPSCDAAPHNRCQVFELLEETHVQVSSHSEKPIQTTLPTTTVNKDEPASVAARQEPSWEQLLSNCMDWLYGPMLS